MRTIFYFIYFLLPAEKSFSAWMKRSVKRLKAAERFGGADMVILGDSNGYTLNNFRKLMKLKGITVCAAVPGSTFTDWSNYFLTAEGEEFLEMIAGKKIVWNCGGNDAIRNSVDELSVATCYSVTPASWIFDVLPVPEYVLDSIAPGTSKRIAKMNKIIQKYWPARVMKTEGLEKFQDKWFIVTKDGIHYRDAVDYNIRIPLLRAL